MVKSENISIVISKKMEGVNTASQVQAYQDALIVMTIKQTINSVSGFNNISDSAALDYKIKGKTIIMIGKNCTYKAGFVIDGDYITSIIYNDCN